MKKESRMVDMKIVIELTEKEIKKLEVALSTSIEDDEYEAEQAIHTLIEVCM